MFADADGTQKKAIAFFAKAHSFGTPLVVGTAVDLLATFDDSEFAGRKELRLKIKDEEEKYMQREWKQRFGNWAKNEWIQKYNVLQGQLIADYLKKA